MAPEIDNGEKQIMKMLVMLTRIEEKQSNMHQDVTEIKKDVKKQNGRVRKLEIKNGYLWGGLGVVAILVPIIVKFLL